MKCPRCNEEIEENVKFCTKCGANIKETIAEKEEKDKKRQKAIEDKKKLEELRKEEERKRKEAEKEEAIRKAKEEGIELEIVDQKPEEEKQTEFKVKQESKTKKEKKKRIKVKKNIFQIIINKILLMIIVAGIIIGAIYYCYSQKLLPEIMQNEIEEFDNQLHNVINLYKETK